ncbi:UTRA domain-containing protein [Lichenicoccus sp.]|uniref:UTRA domain-containing protein n=1 Tax=Lichenicoccus sp. TaxID=2781899 RepID=UPI003D0DC407
MQPPAGRPVTQPSIGARIEQDLERKILSGAWPPGSRIPYEHQLMEQFSCSRMTVSKVLNGLSSRGLIVRRSRAGSFVASPSGERSILRIEDLAEVASRTNQIYRHLILKRQDRPATRRERADLRLAQKTRVLEVSCRHELDAVPVAWEERLIVLSTVSNAAFETFAAVAPGTWLLQHVPWTEAEHVISGLNAGADLAVQLKIAPGDACLELHRRTWLQGVVVTDVRLVYAASRYRFSGRFSPTTSR